MANAKTIGFILAIFALSIIPEFHKKLNRAREFFWQESENAREIYTGKTRAVYEPLDQAYRVSDKLKEMVASSADSDPSHLKKWPVISVLIDPADLNGAERGIFANPLKRGRLWERASHINYFENGKKRFGSYAGMRVHGGVSRNRSDRSIRFYFRKKYGEESFLRDLNITIAEGAPVKRLMLRRDTNIKFATDFIFSVIQKLGGRTPKMKPAAVFINGKFYNFMQMSEHPHRIQAKHIFGHENFVFNKLKGENSSEDHLLYEDAIRRVKHADSPISLLEMSKQFEMDSFTANILAIIYSGNTDWAQGILYKDQNAKSAKWTLISWDFDRAFTPFKGKSFKGSLDHPWEMDSFKIGLNQHDASLRSILINRLLKESPEYQEIFLSRIDQLFEEVLTPEFLETKFAEYEGLAADAGNPKELIEDIQRLKDFVSNRKPVFCKQMSDYLGYTAETCSEPSSN